MNILNIIWETMIHTPWWVYVILFYCIFIGIKCSTTSIVPFWKLAIMPIVFGYMSLDTIFTAFHLDTMVISVYVVSLIIGIMLGMLQMAWYKIEVDPKHYLIKTPGTWSVLIIILIIFISKYWFGYEMAMDPSLLANTAFEVSLLFVSAVTTGLFIGRFSYCLAKLVKGPGVNLKSQS